MRKLNRILEKATKYIACVVFLMIFVLTFTQILYRNIFGSGFAWIEEISTLLLSVFAFFSISYAFRVRHYTFLDYFFKKCSKKIQFCLNVFTLSSMICFLAYLVLTSVGFVKRQWMVYYPITSWPRSFWNLSLPINSVIMISFFAEELIDLVKNRSAGEKNSSDLIEMRSRGDNK